MMKETDSTDESALLKAKIKLAATIKKNVDEVVNNALKEHKGLIAEAAAEAGVSAGLAKGRDVASAAATTAGGQVVAIMEKNGVRDALEAVLAPSVNAASKNGVASVSSTKALVDKIIGAAQTGVFEATFKKADPIASGDVTGTLKKIADGMKKEPAVAAVVRSALMKKNGDVLATMAGFMTGSGSLEVENQDSSGVADVLRNEEQAEDALMQVHNFIESSCEDYQQLTGEHISFDKL